MGDKMDLSQPKHVPKSSALKSSTERFQIGNSNTLALDKAFKREAGKGNK